MLYVVTGGSGSGKSEYAEKIAVQCHEHAEGTLFYLATMRVWDDEGRQRVERHRQMRAAKGFETIERYTGLETLNLREEIVKGHLEDLERVDAVQYSAALKQRNIQKISEKSGRAENPETSENIETSENSEFQRIPARPVLLLECMSNLVLNEFYDEEEGTQERILRGIKHLQNQCRDLIIVTNEIFSDGVTYDPESERYIKLLGQINRALGRMADSVTEVVYGIPLEVPVLTGKGCLQA